MSVESDIHSRLQRELVPHVLEIADESEAHRGHAGYPEGGQSHFRISIGADALTGLSRIDQHRAIHAAIGTALLGKIHALSIQVVPRATRT